MGPKSLEDPKYVQHSCRDLHVLVVFSVTTAAGRISFSREQVNSIPSFSTLFLACSSSRHRPVQLRIRRSGSLFHVPCHTFDRNIIPSESWPSWWEIPVRAARSSSVGQYRRQAVVNAPGARQRGYDAHKKISGRKRHIAVDTDGRLLALNLTTADIADSTGAHCWIRRPISTLPSKSYVDCRGRPAFKRNCGAGSSSAPWHGRSASTVLSGLRAAPQCIGGDDIYYAWAFHYCAGRFPVNLLHRPLEEAASSMGDAFAARNFDKGEEHHFRIENQRLHP